MKTSGRVEVKLQAFSIPTQDGSKVSASHSGRFIHEEKALCILWI
jgi:hypothetical protein